jgi:predicted Holliday junction resolvase-like endonuclease
MYTAILIIVLPILAVIMAIVFLFSRRGGRISEGKQKIDMKMHELEEELEKRKKSNY